METGLSFRTLTGLQLVPSIKLVPPSLLARSARLTAPLGVRCRDKSTHLCSRAIHTGAGSSFGVSLYGNPSCPSCWPACQVALACQSVNLSVVVCLFVICLSVSLCRYLFVGMSIGV